MISQNTNGHPFPPQLAVWGFSLPVFRRLRKGVRCQSSQEGFGLLLSSGGKVFRLKKLRKLEIFGWKKSVNSKKFQKKTYISIHNS